MDDAVARIFERQHAAQTRTVSQEEYERANDWNFFSTDGAEFVCDNCGDMLDLSMYSEAGAPDHQASNGYYYQGKCKRPESAEFEAWLDSRGQE